MTQPKDFKVTSVPPNLRVEPLPLDDTPVRFDHILARAKVMKRVLNRLLAAAQTNVAVLILGETGTGKDLAAESIHLRSRHREGPFVALNVGAIPRDLVASELFGHEAGSFTGAQTRRQGKLARAQGGTLFLDEINSMDLQAQAALLRVLENGSYFPVGSDQSRTADVRIIAASNADLQALAAKGLFRLDLYWRLETFILHLPPLRERPGAVPLLAQQFLREFNAAHGLSVKGIDEQAAALLESYPWPGNVRELKNVIQSALLIARTGMLGPQHLPERILQSKPDGDSFKVPDDLSLKALTAAYSRHVLAACGGNKSKAADRLGITRKSLYAILKRSHDK
ncbi:MAG TPA: sigma 54-interacting transcriptional regulator [bacterium]|jgi:transcriptional regulator with PAS, ATPase and Fis domain|nr:sigma 54-interacting transcriptional regulator [bacterium]